MKIGNYTLCASGPDFSFSSLSSYRKEIMNKPGKSEGLKDIAQESVKMPL